MAFFDAAWYVHFGDGATTGYFAVPKWAASTSTPPGTIIRPFTAPAINSERVYVAIQTATQNTGATEPTWTFTRGVRVTDGSVTWQECSGAAALNGDLFNAPTWNNNFLGSKAISLGQVITNSAQTFVFICSVAGTTAASEPTWNTAAGATTVSNTATWVSLGPVSNWPIWKAPMPRLQAVCAANWGVAGNDILIADNSAETSTATATIALGGSGIPCRFLSVDHTAPMPPTTMSALKAGASVSSSFTTQPAINLNNIAVGNFYMYGLTFIGTGVLAGNSILLSGSQAGAIKLENCQFVLAGASTATSTITIGGGSNTCSDIELVNCTYTFNVVGQSVLLQAGQIRWRNTPHPCFGGAIVPTQPFHFFAGAPCNVLFEGVDLTQCGSAALFANISGGWVTLKNCKLHTGAICQGLTNAFGAANVDVVNCDSGANYWRTERWHANGNVVTSITMARQGGASDGANPLSHFYTTTVVVRSPWKPFIGIPLYVWNNVVGSPVTVTVYGLVFSIANLWNDQIWMDAQYMGSAGSPIALLASTGMSGLFDTHVALTPDTASLWGQSLPLRQNNAVYSAGAIFRVASNPTRLFFVSGGGGTAAASEPAWYATANDGDHAADGTCSNVVCGQRFKMSVTVTPQQRGYITVYPKTALGLTFYIDPQTVLS